MKIFEKDYKINFVDENNVLVGFDWVADCCENFGYFFSYDIPTEIDEDGIELDLEPYYFDNSFTEKVRVENDWSDNSDFAIFKLTAESLPDIYLSLYNEHNGYYSHGFEMIADGKEIQGGSL